MLFSKKKRPLDGLFSVFLNFICFSPKNEKLFGILIEYTPNERRIRMKDANLKPWLCDGCFQPTEVEEDHQPEMCCDGYMCGCYGKPTNPVFCETCEEKLFGREM